MTTTDDRPRPGRRRDPGLDEIILEAALAEFVEKGYRSTSIEGIAARAGVGKATIYRRYPTKASLIVDALRARLRLVDVLPDTGDLRADLIAMATPLVERLCGSDGPTLVAFMAERLREPELAAEFDRSVIGHKRVHLRKLVRDAVERGDLAPDTDVDVVAEMVPAIVWHHALNHLPLDRGLPERVVDEVIRPRLAHRR